MDGFGTDSKVTVFAATNRKELLDNALVRPGRFDRIIEINLPDIKGREGIFMIHLAPLKIDQKLKIEELSKRLATLTPGFSGAEIHNLCNEAAIYAARENKQFIEIRDFERAAEKVIAGIEKKSTMTTEERRKVAVHESGHAVVSWFLKGGSPLLKLTIMPRSKGALGFAQYLPNESSIETREEFLDKICCVLGGRMAEEVFFGKISTGAADDIQKARDMAYTFMGKLGMGKQLENFFIPDAEYVRRTSDYLQSVLDSEVRVLVNECKERARNVIEVHREKVEALSASLLEKETLDLKAIIEVLGERPFKMKDTFAAYISTKQELDKEEKEEEEKKTKEIEIEKTDGNDSHLSSMKLKVILK